MVAKKIDPNRFKDFVLGLREQSQPKPKAKKKKPKETEQE